jgi:hypothetical protein
MTRTALLFAALACALLGCSGSADTAAAEQAVSSFHELLNAGRFAEIYGLSSDELKKASAQSDFVALLDAVHRKLGNTKSAVDQAGTSNIRRQAHSSRSRTKRFTAKATLLSSSCSECKITPRHLLDITLVQTLSSSSRTKAVPSPLSFSLKEGGFDRRGTRR